MPPGVIDPGVWRTAQSVLAMHSRKETGAGWCKCRECREVWPCEWARLAGRIQQAAQDPRLLEILRDRIAQCAAEARPVGRHRVQDDAIQLSVCAA